MGEGLITNVINRNNLLKENVLSLVSSFLVSIIFYLFSIQNTISLFYLGSFVLFITMMFSTIDYSLLYLFFLIPNERMFMLRGTGIALVPFCIIIIFLRIIFSKTIKLSNGILLIEIVLFVFMLMKNFILQDGFIDFDIIRVMMNFFIIYYFINRAQYLSPDFPKRMSLWFVYGCMVSSFLGIFYRMNLGRDLFLYRFANINNDPNYYGVAIALSISLLLVQYQKTYKSLYIFSALLMFLLGALSISRGYLVANIGNFYLLLSIIFKSFKTRKGSIIFLIIGLISILWFLRDFLQQMILTFQSRFSVDDVSSGRIDLWKQYSKLITRDVISLFWGLGKWNREFFLSNYSITNVSHNILIGGIASKGLLLTLTIIVSYVYLFFSTVSLKRYGNDYSKLIIVTIILGYSFLDAITANILQYGFFLFLVQSLNLKPLKEK